MPSIARSLVVRVTGRGEAVRDCSKLLIGFVNIAQEKAPAIHVVFMMRHAIMRSEALWGGDFRIQSNFFNIHGEHTP